MKEKKYYSKIRSIFSKKLVLNSRELKILLGIIKNFKEINNMGNLFGHRVFIKVYFSYDKDSKNQNIKLIED